MQKDKIKEIAAGVKAARAEGLHHTENRGIYTAEDHGADVRDYMLGNLLDGKDEKMPPAIGEEAVKHAQVILQEYKAAKQFFDSHVISDEKWWELRHWEDLNSEDGETNSARERGEIDPKSAWAFNSVINKHADFMDAVPTFVVLAREESDENAAELLSQILPVIYEQNNYEEKYDAVAHDKCTHGTGCWGVFWDGKKLGGLGDITITDVDVLRLFWEGGVKNIQDSPNLFYVTEMNREDAEAAYPELAPRLNTGGVSNTVEEYSTVDYVDKTGKVEIVDWYYHRGDVLHLCKFAAGVVLFSTENEPENFPNGIYKHGKYPFFIDRMYVVKRSPAGFGIIDIAKSDQEVIDRTRREAVNDVLSGGQKTFVKDDAGVNLDDVADPKKKIIRFSGQLDDRNFRTVQPTSNAESYMNVVAQSISQLKETTGNNDVVSGNVPAGVTAASAIAALQEQAGKTSRDVIKASYRVHAEVARCVIELIREFYDMPRTFRIIGEGGVAKYRQFSNKLLRSRKVTKLDGTAIDIEPIFDISVSAQKSSPYSAMAQNELAIQFYNAGFFNPANADMALLAIEMMDFKDKDKLIGKISKNGTLYQMVSVLSERLAKAERALGISAGITPGVSAPSSAPGGSMEMPEQNAEGVVSEESHVTKKARERAADSTKPR